MPTKLLTTAAAATTAIATTLSFASAAQAISLDLSSSATGLNLGSTGITYDVSIGGGTGTIDGNFSGGGGSSVTVTFSEAIDLLVTAPDVSLPFNDSTDRANLLVSPSSSISVLDLENELALLTPVTSNLSWTYSPVYPNPEGRPLNQEWSLSALDTETFTFSINTSNGSHTIAKFDAVATVSPEETPEPTSIIGLFALGTFGVLNRKGKRS
ncbi:PEP-CTERM sorting domain-containing protein [Dapis sp. BLCC M229]|uniref:PEP-CTERM sorting domain-containing protein n=1 Tax=Dapis sp. BLCC M229 TaxID=3400188 RepID=UPI003CE703B3